MGLRRGPHVWTADKVNKFFELKKSTPDKVLRASNSALLRSMNLEQFDPVWRQEREIAAPANTDVAVNLPGPGRAGLYSLLISFGMAFSRIFEAFFLTAFRVIGKLALLGGALFLFTLAFRMWNWL